MARALTRDITRSKHAGILAAFREQFVKPGDFPVEDSLAYGQAFEMRNVADYEQLGRADPRDELWQIASDVSLKYNVVISARVFAQSRWARANILCFLCIAPSRPRVCR